MPHPRIAATRTKAVFVTALSQNISEFVHFVPSGALHHFLNMNKATCSAGGSIEILFILFYINVGSNQCRYSRCKK